MYITPLLDQLAGKVKNLVGKYAKAVLFKIESNKELNISRQQYIIIRKIILDGFNDLGREYVEITDKLLESD